MNVISAPLQAHYTSENVSVAKCLRLQRLDGTIYGFTSLDRDISFGGVTYAALRGVTGSDIVGGSTLAVDTSEISGMLNSDNITEVDLHAGRWDYCGFRMFEVNYRDLTMGERKIRQGVLGQCTTNRAGFVAELVGMLQKYQSIVVEISSIACRASLGDARCMVDLLAGSPPYTTTGSISSVVSLFTIADSGRFEPDDYFTYGVIRFTSGANSGIGREVKSFISIGGVIGIQLPFPYPVVNGDTYSMHAGCDKDKQTCITKFNNIANMRAEPDLQGRDRLVQVGRS